MNDINFQNEFIRRRTPEQTELLNLKQEYMKEKKLYMVNQKMLDE